MPALENAIQLAVEAHRGQVDKSGEPYILHLMRVMLAVEGETPRTIAILHDVIEDTNYTLEDLREANYSEEICRMLDLLTRREHESYADYVERCGTDAVARQVKLADLDDHLRAATRHLLSDGQVIRYQKAWCYLTRLENNSRCACERNDR